MEKSITVILDCRESHLKEEFQLQHIPFKIESLVVGDIVIKDHDNNIVFVCERKTISDFYGSIVSGRYAEQRERLSLLKKQGTRIAYIIEKFADMSFHTTPLFKSDKTARMTSAICGAIENLVLYHDIHVIPTLSVNHTARTIANIYSKLSKKPLVMKEQSHHCLGDNVPVCVQRKDKVIKNIFYQQLLLIPGISMNVAEILVEKYKSNKGLINAYNELEDIAAKEVMLSGISLGKRRLGKVLSKRIYAVYNSDNGEV